ncbi:MAG: methyltransferase domain-containing protein [Bacteroidota bacterium]
MTKSSIRTIRYSSCPLCNSKAIGLAMATKDYSISKEAFNIYRCQNCDFHFTQDIPAPEAIGPYYDSSVYISHSDTKEGFVNRIYHSARELMLNKKRQLVTKLTSGKRLLDIGSGTGYFLNHMQENGYEVIGVEIDADARQATKAKFGIDVNPTTPFLENKIRQQVDIITLWHVLEHLHDMDGYMQSMHRQLKDDGVVLIAVPNHKAYDAQHYGKHWAAYDVPRHLWHFSPKTVARLADKNGFKVVAQKRLPLDPFYNALLSEKYQASKLSLIFGGLIGLVALLVSYVNTARSTSPIYVLRKK